jgi:hypothetical protein
MGDEKVRVVRAYNPVEQFATIDKLKHHVNLGFASSNLNELNSHS